jgi:iron complex outermembrane receptor protein
MFIQASKGVLSFTIAACSVSHVSAQTQVDPPVVVGAPVVQDSGTLQDIVVTAQRRSERLQDVPISVIALSSDTLTSAGVNSTNDLAFAVPGLELGRQNGSISPFIRGIGNKSTAPGEESAVAIYVDGVYIPTLSAGLFTLDNVQRVEVLKGPQGTLFGRNAAAGVIQIITRDPTAAPKLDAKIGYGNFNTVTGSAYLTGEVARDVRADLSVYYQRQNEGWGKNLTTGNDVFRGREIAVRTKWMVDLDAQTTFTAEVDYDKSRPNTPSAYRPLKGRFLIDGTPYSGFFNVAENRDVYTESEQWGANAQLRHEFDAFSFVSITSYRWTGNSWIFDQDGTPTNYVLPTVRENSRTFTQELQLLSPSSSPIQWIVGGFYFDNRAGYNPLRLQGDLFGSAIIDRFAFVSTNSLAAFGQVTVPIGEATKVTGGLRFTHDRRELDAHNVTNAIIVGVPSQRALFDKLTWRGSIDHRFSPEALVYATVSRGFKSGVFNTVTPTDPAVRPETVDTYEAGIKTDLFDRHLRLNGATFYNKFKDVQFQVNIPGGTRLINAAAATTYGFELDAEARVFNALSLRAGLSYLHGRYGSFTNAPFYIRTATGLGGSTAAMGDATGKDTIHTPPFTLSAGADYTLTTKVGSVTLSGSYAYNDGFFFDAENALPQKSYSLVGASIRLLSEDGRWGVRVWGKNLTDTQYYTAMVPQRWGDTATPAEPRTFGATLELHLK